MSLAFRVADALGWCEASLVQGDPDARLSSVCIDSRALRHGQLFVAIRGPRHDGHDFLGAAVAAGVGGLLLEHGHAPPATPSGAPEPAVLAVGDTTRALGELAAGHRAGFAGPLVAITGSNGKTTTKEMCAAILAVGGPCLKNAGNLNNQYGLPLTLLERGAEHRSVVVELGMNHAGEIAPLAQIARPSVGVITNVGTAHIEHLGSREAIAREKGELVAALAADATAVLNADDPLVLAQAERTRARVVRFGCEPGADVRAEDLSPLGASGFRFALVADGARRTVQVAGLGRTTVLNALAAAAAALAAGAGLDAVVAGLSAYRPVAGRLQHRALACGAFLIDDSYNANPQSTEVALRSLAELRGKGRAIAVLGEMGELGGTAGPAHRDAGELAAGLGVDTLVALGRHAEETARGARAAGLPEHRVHVAPSHEAAAEAAGRGLQEGDWVLVKGSRSMRMERVVQALVAGSEEA